MTIQPTLLRAVTAVSQESQRALPRRQKALWVRQEAALLASQRPHPQHISNGDETRYSQYIGNYSKGLPHNSWGEVDKVSYQLLLRALQSGASADFTAIPLGGGRRLTSPQAGLAYDLEGPDAQAVTIPPAPRLDSAETAGEMCELYWMALLRDVPFVEFNSHPLVAEAAADLSKLSDFRGPQDPQARCVTPATLFRGFTPGDLVGPYLSQFILHLIRFGSLEIHQRNETVAPGVDYLTRSQDWLAVQNGAVVSAAKIDRDNRLYLRNMRDVAHYVEIDALYEAYLNAALILLDVGAPVSDGNPYKSSSNQIGFATFGGPHLLSLVTEVATRALKAVWFQKWFVHRRLRPEAYAGLVHHHHYGNASYPVHRDILRSAVLDRVYAKNKKGGGEATYLLPMAFVDGCPTHPAYGAGHATVAGACVTVLKAWFDEACVLKNKMRLVEPSADGRCLVNYRGADSHYLTLGGELNKLAANIAIGRNMAGVHWRSDYTESVKLGERVAIGILEEQSLTYNEPHFYTLTTFEGRRIRIENGQTRPWPC